jgi:hypothetical protein
LLESHVTPRPFPDAVPTLTIVEETYDPDELNFIRKGGLLPGAFGNA